MQLSDIAISTLARVMTGDGGTPSPYMSGKELMAFFAQYKDLGDASGSRREYTSDCLIQANGTETLDRIVEDYLDVRRFIGCDFSVDDAAALLNDYIEHDGYRLVKGGHRYRVANASGASVTSDVDFELCSEKGAAYIERQIEKCNIKLGLADYDGAITNARSLVETVLLELERSLDPGAGAYNGDLVKLYKRVQGLLNLDPGAEAAESLRQILSGLTSVVNGLAGLRNKMSDAHATTYKPARHHAKLAVNAATTLVDFMFETNAYQRAQSTVVGDGQEAGSGG
jgi:hypothetical protein